MAAPGARAVERNDSSVVDIQPPAPAVKGADQLGPNELPPDVLHDPLEDEPVLSFDNAEAEEPLMTFDKPEAGPVPTGEVSKGKKATRGRFAAEALKPAIVGGIAAAGAGLASADKMSSGAGASLGIGALGTAVGLSNIVKGATRDTTNDEGGKGLAREQIREGVSGTVGGTLSTAQAGLGMNAIAQGGENASMGLSHFTGAAQYAPNALSTAAAQVGLAGAAVGAAQALYTGGVAVKRAMNVSDVPIYSTKGKGWKDRAGERQKTKTLMQGLKLAAAALGIAAGVLALASNPVGWVIGLTGAVLSLGFFLFKAGASAWKMWKMRKERKALQAQAASAKAPPSPDQAPPTPKEADADSGGEPAAPQVDHPDGAPVAEQAMAQVKDAPANPEADKAKITEIKDLAKEAEKIVSQNARAAHEMHDASIAGAKGEAAATGKDTPINLDHDAEGVAGALDVNRKELESKSGKDLLEKRLSALDDF